MKEAIEKPKANKAEAGGRIEYNTQLNSLKAKRDAVGQKLSEVKTVGEDAWESMKSGVEGAWSELKSAVDGAASKFK